MKISLTLPEELLKDMDKVCLDEKYERSEFIRTAIRERIYPKGIQPTQELPKEKWVAVPGKVELPERRAIEPSKVEGWCQTHFEKNAKYVLKLVTWEDENGTPVIDKKMICPKCITKYENMGRGHLYYL